MVIMALGRDDPFQSGTERAMRTDPEDGTAATVTLWPTCCPRRVTKANPFDLRA